jgi:hypothetical protein
MVMFMFFRVNRERIPAVTPRSCWLKIAALSRLYVSHLVAFEIGSQCTQYQFCTRAKQFIWNVVGGRVIGERSIRAARLQPSPVSIIGVV